MMKRFTHSWTVLRSIPSSGVSLVRKRSKKNDHLYYQMLENSGPQGFYAQDTHARVAEEARYGKRSREFPHENSCVAEGNGNQNDAPVAPSGLPQDCNAMMVDDNEPCLSNGKRKRQTMDERSVYSRAQKSHKIKRREKTRAKMKVSRFEPELGTLYEEPKNAKQRNVYEQPKAPSSRSDASFVSIQITL